ncbi:MAG: hypothetical protein KDD89_00680, partial [Anaerolineales bacterium]|nr:hypothetical protein [Anaerolineales bacterium]
MNRIPSRSVYFVLAFAACALALWLGKGQLATADNTPAPHTAVETAWQRANQSGVYHYSTNIVQQTTPQLTLDNVGLGPTTERLYLEGSLDKANETMSLKLWGQDGNVLLGSGGLEIKVEHGRALARTSTNDWQEVDSLVDFFAPGQDPLGFLSAATNIQKLPADTPDGVTATRYRFDLSGPAFARYMRDQFEAELNKEGKLPQGVELGLATQFVQMTGTGELWLDAHGLPLRQAISVTFPPDQNQQVTAEITTDFRDWATLPAAPTTAGNFFQQGLASLTAIQVDTTAVVSNLSLLLLITASLALMLRWYRSPHFYNGLVLLLIFSMVVVPLVQATEVGAFYDTIYAEQSPPTNQQTNDTTQPNPPPSPFDPHQDPLRRLGNLPTAVSITNNPPPELPLRDNGQDSDGDGLTDAQEIFLESDPNNPDQDGDTLTDGIEVLELGSSIHAEFGADTDGDGLTDDAEVNGFDYAGQTWYLDFSNPDSNGDGLADAFECTQDSTTRALTCPDSDGDNTPDAFDDDNDNDGVPDRNDLDSDHLVGDPTTGLADGQFRYGLTDLNADRPVYVDFQLRPTNPNRLWYTLNVLDWPSDDRQGQVQRVFDTTFGDTGQLADGDLRLVPMLEIEIPFDPANGQYGNLPIKAGAPPITAVTPLEDWLDTAVTRAFGISVRQGIDNNLYAYVPLNLVRPSGDADPVAFSGRMFYQPQDSNGDTLADWGNDHQASLVWLVEAITDRCLDEIDDDFEPDITDESERRQKWCADNDNWVSNGSSIIHVYRDDWYLTGLQVREEAGTSMAVAFQDPAYTTANYTDLNGFYEDSLWILAQGLDSSFIAGRADVDNARTLVLDDIINRWDKDSAHPDHQDDTKRWDIPADALIVERYDFAHQALIGSMAVTHTAVLLDSYFSGTAIQDPTLLFAREEKYRVLSLTVQEQVTPLDGATWQNGQLNGNGLHLAVAESAAPPLVVVGMSWSPFRNLGGGWETYPLAEYWEDHEVGWETTLSETWDDPDELFGASLATSSFYMTMVHGLTALAEIDGLAAGSVSSLSDDFLQTELRAQTASALSTAVNRWGNIMNNSASFTSGTGSLLDNLTVTANGTLDWTRPVFDLGQIKEIATTNYRIFKGQRDAAWLDDLRQNSFNVYRFEANANVVGNYLPATTYKVAKVSAAVDQVGLFVGVSMAALQLSYEILLMATQSDRIQVLDGMFAAINLALASVSLVAIYSNLKLVVALQALQVGSTTTAVKNVVNEAVKQASLSVGAIVSLIVIAAVQIGIFTYLILSEGITAFSLEFNLALAGVVAGLIVVVLLVAIAAIPLVGQLIAAIIGLIDAAIAFICIAAGVNNNEDWVGQWVCPGINGLLTKAVQWLIYDQSPIVDLGRGDRLQLADLHIDLVHKNLGLSASNALHVSLDLGSALYATGPDSPMSLIYFWQYGDDYVRDTTLRYALMRNQDSTDGSLAMGQMRDEWLAPPSASDVWGSGSRFIYTTTLNTATPVTLNQAGLNRPLNNLYIAEGQAIPVQECVLIPIPYGPIIVPTPTCWLRADNNTTHIDLGSNLIFDVFPTTIDEFMSLTARGDNQYALSWMTDTAAPSLADADGDGLRSPALGGNDPNDALTDTDGDTLSDYLEVKLWGTDPAVADIDGD